MHYGQCIVQYSHSQYSHYSCHVTTYLRSACQHPRDFPGQTKQTKNFPSHPRHPNTLWVGVWTPKISWGSAFRGSKLKSYLEDFGCLGSLCFRCFRSCFVVPAKFQQKVVVCDIAESIFYWWQKWGSESCNFMHSPSCPTPYPKYYRN